MYKESWGLKRICPCNRVMYYDLGRKELECPECGKLIKQSTMGFYFFSLLFSKFGKIIL